MSPYIYFESNPVCDFLTNNYLKIRDEFYKYLETNKIKHNDTILTNDEISKGKKPNALDILYSGSFKGVSFYLRRSLVDVYEAEAMKWTGPAQEILNPALAYTHLLRSFIYENKSILGSVTFNVSHPGSTLRHHFGLDPDYIRLHLCIKEETSCVFDIENSRHIWKEGELFGFDDANVLHGTKHYDTGLGPRIIVLVDVRKDYLKPFAKTWPCRDKRPLLKDILPLKGWDEGTELELFVKGDSID